MSHTDVNNLKIYRNTGFIYLIVSIFLALTGFIYEHFSHGVFSYSMVYAFSVPLVLGTLLNAVLERVRMHMPGSLTRQIWHCGVATLTVGLLVSGVFEIYGAANPWINYYYIAGFVLLALSLSLYFVKDNRKRETD